MTEEELWVLSVKVVRYGVFLGIALKIGIDIYNKSQERS